MKPYNTRKPRRAKFNAFPSEVPHWGWHKRRRSKGYSYVPNFFNRGLNHTNEGIANRYDHPWISAAYKNANTEWPVGKRDTITSTLLEFFYMLYMVPSHVTKLFAMGIGINCIISIISIVTTL